MSEGSRKSSQIALLVVNLVIAAVCVAVLLAMIVIYPTLWKTFFRATSGSETTLRPTPTWTALPTVTLTPTLTRTPRPIATQTATLTPTPSETPTETLTGTNLPTLTPAQALAYSDAYELLPWSPAPADYMVQLMQGYPTTIGSTNSSASSQAYFQAFEIPVIALREALLRFPGVSQADSWAWTLAFDLALAGNPQAGERYADLIAGGLNRDETDISQLYAWFQLKEPRLQFFMVEANIPPGYMSSYLIELRGSGGSALIRLLEKNRVFRAQSLYTSFDFVNPREVTWILSDLNGNPEDGEEFAFYSSSASGETLFSPPRVFNLFGEIPLELPFLPLEKTFQVGMDYTNYWKVEPSKNAGNDLVFESPVFPACPVTLRRVYHWNELYFKLVTAEYRFGTLPDDLSICETIIDHAAHFWPPAVVASLMDDLTDLWPPKLNLDGLPYPGDAKDEWLYRLGVYRALSGDDPSAVKLFDQVSTQPTVPSSRWIVPAQEFLAALQKPESIYTACQSAQFCNPAFAIQYLVKRLPSLPEPSQDALDILRKWGLTVNSSGFFDFDRDDEAERWFTIRYFPREKLSFWILAKRGVGYTALEIPNIESSRPTIDYIDDAYIADEALQYKPAILLDGAIAFSMQRVPDTQQPYLVEIKLRKEYPSRFFVPLEHYKNALLDGASPEIIQQKLKILGDFPGLLCKTTWSCDEYYYLLGLSSELARDQSTAVKAYQRLWLDYTKSPFTTMARLKLQVIGGALATPTATTSTTLLTPTQTRGTLTPTATGPTPTPTTSRSPTVTGTPPTFTPTFTQGALPAPTFTGAPPTSGPTPTPIPSISAYPGPLTPTQGAGTPYPTP